MDAPRRRGPLARVLGLSLIGWFLVLLFAGARQMLVLQLRLLTRTEPRHAGYTAPGSPFPECSLLIEPAMKVRAEDLLWLADSGRGYPPDALAAAVALRVPCDDAAGDAARQVALDRLRTLAPSEPRTWALVLWHHWAALRSAAGEPWRPGPVPTLTSDERRAVRDAIVGGRSRDPHNALWTLAEMLLAAADRDNACIRSCALRLPQAWHFCDYSSEVHGALADSLRRLGHSSYRAGIGAYEWGSSTPARLWPVECIGRLALRQEQAGRHVEAIGLYAAVAHLDRLMVDHWTSEPRLGPRPVSALERLAKKRHEWVSGPRDEPVDLEAGKAWRARAWDGLIDYFLARGETGLALRASEAHQRHEDGVRAAQREYDRVGSVLELAQAGTCFWYVQLVLLGLSLVAGSGTFALWRVSVGLAQEPPGRWALRAIGPALVLTAGCVPVVLCGLAPPSYGLGAASSPPTLVQQITFLALVALAALTSPYLVARAPMAGIRKVADGAFVAARWLAAVCSFLYVWLTLGQAWFQSWAADKLCPW